MSIDESALRLCLEAMNAGGCVDQEVIDAVFTTDPAPPATVRLSAYVDPVKGDDETARRGDPTRPYKITAAAVRALVDAATEPTPPTTVRTEGSAACCEQVGETAVIDGAGISGEVFLAYQHAYFLRDDRDEETRQRVGLAAAILKDRELRSKACGGGSPSPSSAASSAASTAGRQSVTSDE